MKHFDVIIIGSGLTGSVAAIGAAKKGLLTALVSPVSCFHDLRTTMLMDEGVGFLKELDIWDSLQHVVEPVSSFKLVDITGCFITAPDAVFKSSEIGIDAFGYNIPNYPFIEALTKKISQEPLIHCFDALADEMQIGEKNIAISLSTGQKITGKFLVGSDGRNSSIRRQMGCGEKNWSYPQKALVLNFKHSMPHHGLCVEFHKSLGTITQIPLQGNCSSLVWMMESQEADFYHKLPINEIARRLEQYLYSIVGKIEVVTDVQSFQLSSMVSRCFGENRVVLVGEAAHVLPPIYGQGFNLSMRDVIVLLNMIQCDQVSFEDIGSRYHSMRRGDILGRIIGVDLFNRSLFAQYPFLHLFRVGTLHVLGKMIPLRHQVMRQSLFVRNL
ncbi:FAD-dependent monooxygenase [Candidatus Liberibacter africanus]|uniref:2-octaprenyl-6-methoxyphenyl hydroxylase n=1 Tax=Candidatus Liberibacter africanus PTSAPSY TaxID=1277257 RepID=A0A0G3I3F3_LIBAF|nr:FAD-dependent monooxygenase [Candidatus Liberibacter africanus]AKK19795.1 2-octaprenyl-6-methoxyphenyl hydroxylase [Candidatus Liberibacter africanus PTSAPSY]QTP63662.1 FAD-dependent monooxygenase [Candidatus Liberibacter africanus]